MISLWNLRRHLRGLVLTRSTLYAMDAPLRMRLTVLALIVIANFLRNELDIADTVMNRLVVAIFAMYWRCCRVNFGGCCFFTGCNEHPLWCSVTKRWSDVRLIPKMEHVIFHLLCSMKFLTASCLTSTLIAFIVCVTQRGKKRNAMNLCVDLIRTQLCFNVDAPHCRFFKERSYVEPCFWVSNEKQ